MSTEDTRTDPTYVARRTAAADRLNAKLADLIVARDQLRYGTAAYVRANNLVTRTSNAAYRAEIDAERGYPLDTRLDTQLRRAGIR